MQNTQITLNDAISAFLDFIRKAREPQTHKTYKSALQKFSDIVGNDAQLTKDTYIKFLLATSSTSKATQAMYRSAIHRLYRYIAGVRGGVDTSFFDLVNEEYGLKRPTNFVNPNMDAIQKTVDYVNTIRSNPEDLRDRTYILLLADSGLRVSEACGLHVNDVDLLEGKVVIIGKGDKPAIVHISKRTITAMREYFRTRTISKAAPVFIHHSKQAGNKIIKATPGYMWHFVKRRIAEAGVDPETNIRPHDLRHFFVTTVYRAKGIKLAQKLARHTRISTTDRYTHLVEDEGEAYDEIFNR
jgi:integrase/recombinase XerC